jgi:hypothetical protein
MGLVAWVISWILYLLGDLISRPMNRFDWAWLYPAYNRLMVWSMIVQQYADNKTPWRYK